VFGTPGRAAVEERLPGLKEALGAGFCVVNAENTADGAGLTPRLADRLLAAGADALTLGNHVWRRKEIGPYLDSSDRVVRPANLASSSPGRGLAVVPAADGTPVAVLNLQGLLFMSTPISPFEVLDALVEEARACGSSPRAAAFGSRARSWSATPKGARSAASRFGFPSRRGYQHREQHDQDEIPREHEPGRDGLEGHEIPVADGEPELGQ
jgi:hypothetical protein